MKGNRTPSWLQLVPDLWKNNSFSFGLLLTVSLQVCESPDYQTSVKAEDCCSPELMCFPLFWVGSTVKCSPVNIQRRENKMLLNQVMSQNDVNEAFGAGSGRKLICCITPFPPFIHTL